MSLEILLLAAEYIDRRETEHGYACRDEPPKRPVPVQSRTSRRYGQRRRRQVFKLTTSFSGKSSACRTTHNELEKNRRAELRGCIDKLKSVVPLDSGCHRHTTHRLLINARKLIKSLEGGLRASVEERDRQLGVQRRLRRQYQQLTVVAFQTHQTSSAASSTSRRTGSRCSTSSTESTESSGVGDSVSCPSSDESEMIDVECASDCASDVDSGCDDDGHLS